MSMLLIEPVVPKTDGEALIDAGVGFAAGGAGTLCRGSKEDAPTIGGPPGIARSPWSCCVALGFAAY